MTTFGGLKIFVGRISGRGTIPGDENKYVSLMIEAIEHPAYYSKYLNRDLPPPIQNKFNDYVNSIPPEIRKSLEIPGLDDIADAA